MQVAKQTSYLWVPSSPAQFGMFCRMLSKPSMTCQHLGTMVALLVLLVLVQLMVHVLWVLTYLFLLNSHPRTGHIPPLNACAALHVIPTCCGQDRCWDICGAARLRDVWICV